MWTKDRITVQYGTGLGRAWNGRLYVVGGLGRCTYMVVFLSILLMASNVCRQSFCRSYCCRCAKYYIIMYSLLYLFGAIV